MTDITEKTENGELVTNRDQLVVVDNIESLIKVFRGQQVMLDKDLATLYGVETRTLNQAVKRNPTHFNDGKRNMNAGKTKVRIKMNNVWYIYCGGVYFLLVVHLFSFS